MINKLYFTSNFNSNIIDELNIEKQQIGYYDLPYQNTDYVDNYLKKLDLNNIKDIVIIGIGGSSLGIRAIYHFIKASKNLPRKLYFMGSTDPLSITNTLKKININKAHFIVISKSGETIETIATYKYLLNFIHKDKFSFITDEHSKLDKYAKTNKQIVVAIQKNISGRFSVFSAVGIIPLALAGIDYKSLLIGAKKISNDFWNNKRDDILEKGYFYAKNQNFNINTIFSYSDNLTYFNGWFTQLWGESLGKKQKNSILNVGPTPIGLIGPKDQHSFLQLFADGTRDKTVSFIKIKNLNNTLKVPDIELKHLEHLNNINNIKFSTLINQQADSIIESLRQKNDIPIDEIILSSQDEIAISGLMFYYQLLTSIVGKLLNINTYDQPGVELGKQILIQKLNNNDN